MTAPDPGEREYNRVFEMLVTDSDDLVGLVAYALYKRHKRDWLLALRTKREPTPEDAEAFLTTVVTSLDSYRERARVALVEYGSGYVEDARPQIAVDAIEGRIAEAAAKVEESGSWLRQVGVGVTSSIITTALLLLLAVAVQAAGVDFLEYLRLFNGAPGGG